MRIGVRVTDAEVSAVAETDDDTFANARRPVAGDLVRAVTDVITELRGRGQVSTVVFDVSGALSVAAEQRVVSVLVEPRIPLEPRRHLWREGSLLVRSESLCGGHNALGHELVPLEEEAVRQLAGDIEPGAHVVITATGSSCNTSHERHVAEVLRALVPLASITESHLYCCESLLVREHTAVVNALLLSSAEQLATQLDAAARASTDVATRAFVTTNEGGCTPLTRLAITPVHSLRADVPSTMLGAATLARCHDGRVIIAGNGGVHVGEVIDGLPATVNRVTLPDGTLLASSFAHVVPLTDLLLTGSAEPAHTVLVRGAETALEPFGLAPSLSTDHDLVAIGAAVAPISYLHNRTVQITAGSPDIDAVLREGERIAIGNLVASGAHPDAVRIRESRVLATTYDPARMLRVRIRAVAPTPGRTRQPVDGGG